MLNQVSAIARTQKKLALLSGENFNVFRILKIETREVRTHSAFLGELLNPDGSHGMQDTFLRLFIEQMGFADFANFDTASAKLVVEKHIGQIDADYTEGGRIDIYLESKGEFLFIENKIYAVNQRNQLERYRQHKPHAKLLYLTLDGGNYKAPAGSMLTKEHYKAISYKEDITTWLNNCHRAAAAYPIVRETIQQYIHLINHLTEKTPDNFMKEETKQLLRGDYASFESAWYCSQVVNELKSDILKEFGSELEKAWPIDEVKPVCHLRGYPITMDHYQDDPASDMYYSFKIGAPIHGQQVPEEVANTFRTIVRQVSNQIVVEKNGTAWSPFERVRNPYKWTPREQFEMADKNHRTAVINSMIEESDRDAAKFADLVKELQEAVILS
ncbi:PD-(D/E)XK nuclease family protein [Hymenobacter sp. BT770]|nr:PD-(D/E)XK nuclease family protein [Hymenobacter sp. BT770]